MKIFNNFFFETAFVHTLPIAIMKTFWRYWKLLEHFT